MRKPCTQASFWSAIELLFVWSVKNAQVNRNLLADSQRDALNLAQNQNSLRETENRPPLKGDFTPWNSQWRVCDSQYE